MFVNVLNYVYSQLSKIIMNTMYLRIARTILNLGVNKNPWVLKL